MLLSNNLIFQITKYFKQRNHCAGGELQRTAIVLCLGKPADIYLIDEPSAYLDSEQRLICARVIKRFIMHSKKCGFIVEHDFIMATYLADKVRDSVCMYVCMCICVYVDISVSGDLPGG